jgi:hypothetical protein
LLAAVSVDGDSLAIHLKGCIQNVSHTFYVKRIRNVHRLAHSIVHIRLPNALHFDMVQRLNLECLVKVRLDRKTSVCNQRGPSGRSKRQNASRFASLFLVLVCRYLHRPANCVRPVKRFIRAIPYGQTLEQVGKPHDTQAKPSFAFAHTPHFVIKVNESVPNCI